MAKAKAEGAFLTIGEVSAELGVQQHVLRYWESRFSQLRPLTRAGNRRYYRPADVALARRIHSLLTEQGYTMRGVQQLLDNPGMAEPEAPAPAPAAEPARPAAPPVHDIRGELAAIRSLLADALAADGVAAPDAEPAGES